jgi:NAD(P)H-hydrate epimerase
MKIFRADQVRKIDSYTIKNEPIASIDLMERAADRLTAWYIRRFDISRPVLIFAGPGNNGGDALAVARLLTERKYSVKCFLTGPDEKLSGDCRINLERLKKQNEVKIYIIKSSADFPDIDQNDVIIDGIFGSGLSRIVSGQISEIIRHINLSESTVVSIDIPSGLFGEDNRKNDYKSVVNADITLTFQFPFLSFFFEENADFIGHWRVLDIELHPHIIKETKADYLTIQREDIIDLLPERRTFSHKGTYGHGLLVCGCYGMMGAGLLAAEATLRGGAGLVTLHVPKFGYSIVQTGFPEAIVSIDQSDIIFTKHPELSAFQAVGIGPGIGCKENTGRGLKHLLEHVRVPIVIDADAINLISAHKEWLDLIPKSSVLTPHPKEFDRLAGESASSFERHLKQLEFSRKYNIYIILKGAYTGISTPEGVYFFNSSGNPGMATGGSGDVLTGLMTGLLAQGLNSRDAAISAVYIHGLAGDLALEGSSEESIIAGDIIKHLGPAFRKIKEKSILYS